MSDLALCLRELLAAVRADPPVYATIRERCEAVRGLLTNEAGGPLPSLSVRLLEVLERIWHPGPHWFQTHTAQAVELLTSALEPKTSANKPEKQADRPEWNETDLELRFRGWRKRYRRNAESQMAVLAAFQRCRWKRRIKHKVEFGDLRDTVRNLNSSLGAEAQLKFSRDGYGDGIRWDPVGE
jgi:hypothetical protein